MPTTNAPVTTVPMETRHGPDTIAPKGLVPRVAPGLPRLWTERTLPTLQWNAPTRDFAIARPANAGASRTTMERRANVRSAPTIAPDEEFAYPKNLSRPCRARRTPLLGIPTSTSVASAMMGTVDQIVLRRSAPQEMIFLAGTEVRKGANALDVAIVTLLPVFARVSLDTLETGASIKQFSAK